MPVRRLPVRPDLEQLHRQAKELLRAIHGGDAEAIAEFREHHPESIDPSSAKLADAQLALARSYRASSWTRLVHAVQLADAIWRDDADSVRALISRNSSLIHEHVLIRTDSNWGPPMTYAANLGRDSIIRLLHSHGARDLESAAGRAALQGKIDTVHLICDLAGRPPLDRLSLAGPAYTLSVEGTAVLFALGVRLVGPKGVDTNTMEHILGTDSRNPSAKHRILEMYVEHGFEPPDTPIMALHRGRIDLLEAHLARDPDLLTRTFEISDVFPLAPACAREPYTAQGTPVHGTTLLHIAAYFDELEIAEWLLDRDMDPNAKAVIDADGFGGYTALFSTVVSQRNFWVNYGKGQPDEARFTRLLLDRGADPNVRASLRQRLEEGHGGGPLREYRDVTPLSWGERYDAKIFVSRETLRLIEARGGIR
ncbi:MAG: ankyrin repeat domain-containing protein [Acidobacteria bacterium]|nr:ankyrin repeat domain-containing protein [Acidobacteriota bacterium]